jgi:hypothetical protein
VISTRVTTENEIVQISITPVPHATCCFFFNLFWVVGAGMQVHSKMNLTTLN